MYTLFYCVKDNFISMLFIYFSYSRVTLHIVDYSCLTAIHKQIKDGNNSTFNGFKNYFLINFPSHIASERQKIGELFASTPLSYNYLTFASIVNERKQSETPKLRQNMKQNIKCYFL